MLPCGLRMNGPINMLHLPLLSSACEGAKHTSVYPCNIHIHGRKFATLVWDSFIHYSFTYDLQCYEEKEKTKVQCWNLGTASGYHISQNTCMNLCMDQNMVLMTTEFYLMGVQQDTVHQDFLSVCFQALDNLVCVSFRKVRSWFSSLIFLERKPYSQRCNTSTHVDNKLLNLSWEIMSVILPSFARAESRFQVPVFKFLFLSHANSFVFSNIVPVSVPLVSFPLSWVPINLFSCAGSFFPGAVMF